MNENQALDTLDSLAASLQRSMIVLYGRQYRHDVIMDGLLATSATTAKAIQSARQILNAPFTESVRVFAEILDDMIKESNAK